jgi:ribosomal protein L37AE/L43A
MGKRTISTKYRGDITEIIHVNKCPKCGSPMGVDNINTELPLWECYNCKLKFFDKGLTIITDKFNGKINL